MKIPACRSPSLGLITSIATLWKGGIPYPKGSPEPTGLGRAVPTEQYIVADQRHPNATRVRDEPKPSFLVLTIPHQSLTLWLYVSSCIDVVLINAMMILNTFPRCRVEHPKRGRQGQQRKAFTMDVMGKEGGDSRCSLRSLPSAQSGCYQEGGREDRHYQIVFSNDNPRIKVGTHADNTLYESLAAASLSSAISNSGTMSALRSSCPSSSRKVQLMILRS